MNKTNDWSEDWPSSKKIDGIEYSNLWPHLPRMTYAEWVDALTIIAKL